MDQTAFAKPRVDWVDAAKGICIVLVVMMHSTLGVEKAAGAEGWMHAVVEFARPFRMPDFFLISGLFLARVIDRDWRDYLDRKVVHFVYFYVLWVTIQFAFKAPGFVAERGAAGAGLAYLEAFVEPFGTLWFIYLLPIFFVVIKLTRNVPWPAMLLVGGILETLRVQTGWTVIDEFCARFLYIYAGYVFAPQVFAFAAFAMRHWPIALAGLAAWFAVNAGLVMAGYADTALISIALGFAGAFAIITTAALLTRAGKAEPWRFFGARSIVIYLAFFLPMAASRALLLKTGISDLGSIALIVTVCGVAGALAMHWLIVAAGGRALFERPAWARLNPARRPMLQPAE